MGTILALLWKLRLTTKKLNRGKKSSGATIETKGHTHLFFFFFFFNLDLNQKNKQSSPRRSPSSRAASSRRTLPCWWTASPTCSGPGTGSSPRAFAQEEKEEAQQRQMQRQQRKRRLLLPSPKRRRRRRRKSGRASPRRWPSPSTPRRPSGPATSAPRPPGKSPRSCGAPRTSRRRRGGTFRPRTRFCCRASAGGSGED